jgi:hypothetical protein
VATAIVSIPRKRFAECDGGGCAARGNARGGTAPGCKATSIKVALSQTDAAQPTLVLLVNLSPLTI